jgi:glutaredoxin
MTEVKETLRVFTKAYTSEEDRCPHCDAAKAWLAYSGIPFTEVSLSQGDRQALYDRLGLEGTARTVPQIEITDVTGTTELIGDSKALFVSGIEGLWK